MLSRVAIRTAVPTTARRSWKAEIMAVVLMLYFSLTAYSLTLIPVVSGQLRDQLALSDSQIGLLTSILMLMLGATAIPAGLAAGRLGGRVMIFACGLFVAGSVLFALSSSFGWLLAGRALQGLGAGVTVPACSVVLAGSLPPGKRGRAWGIFGAGHGLGVMIALLVMPSVAQAAGYRGVFLATAALAAALGLAVAVLPAVRALPAQPECLPGLRHLAGCVRTAASNRRLLLLALFNVTTLGVGVGALAWTPHYMEVHFGSATAAAGQLTAMVGAAQLVGNPVGAAAMSRWGKLPVITVSLVLLTVTIVLVPFVSSLFGVCLLVTLAGFLSMAFFSPLYAYIPLVVARPEQVGLASGIVNVFGFGGALLAPYLFGLILDQMGDASGYLTGYLLLTGFAMAGVVGAVLFRRVSRASEPRSVTAYQVSTGHDSGAVRVSR
jgi:MFS transporter, NNP family, nitrate/nitrite transporter